ncbi:type II secretion system F family protein [Actinoplanes sp. DH11]|uniref:type II secretion system F family protein n=1 Tax=Actinoplanes sp. DH11 TaxID=2857011 RepID=UPI001E2E4661|nr:hypothetical protein [Actinoplanes sp. DH11]
MNWHLAALLVTGAVIVASGPRPAARQRLVGRRRADPVVLRAAIPGVRAAAARLTNGPAWRPIAAAAALAVVPALLLGGPVGAVIAGAYAALGAGEWTRRVTRKRAASARAAQLDGLCTLVADLRAGLPPAAVSADGPDKGGRIGRLAGAVWRLAEQTGAPAADLLDRIETDVRAADRAAASAAAQAAGAQATAILLAALPLGGIGLGHAIGADPLAVLLHTPIGAACAVTAVLLQCGGLRWAQRLVDGPR